MLLGRATGDGNTVTCIAGIVHDGTVYIGGDSAGIAGYALTVRADEKVFKKGEWIFGFTSSFRMGDLIRYSLALPIIPPELDGHDLRGIMVTEFVNALRSTLKSGGFAKKENEVETAGTFLVGVRGRLFEIDNDYQVGEPLDGYAAVGCGAEIAVGSLFTSTDTNPHSRVLTALQAAERHSAGVRGPFHIVTT